MKSAEYWQKRFTAVENMNHNSAKKAVQSVTPAFDKAQRQIEAEITTWYQRYADNNKISLQEAKIQLNAKELKELKWDIDDYIKYGKQNAVDQKWMKQLENASAKYHVTRLEALKIRTQNAAEVAFGNEQDVLDQLAARIYTDDYYHTAYEIQKGLGVGFNIGTIDQNRLDRILSKPWTADKMTFSDRIWKSKAQLLDSVDKELTQMCILGKSPDEAIKNLASRMNVSKQQAGRLIMTESAYFASAAQKDCFNELDVEEFEIVATLDSHTSQICRDMDGQHFPMKDYQAGVTAPPFHVWCRSTTVPYFNDEFTVNDTRAARDENGKTQQVPANMNYADWKKTFVDKVTPEQVKLDPEVQKVIDNLKNENIEYRKVEVYNSIPSEETIIDAVSGGDKTTGSCASVALAYAGQKKGYNVLDFRDGASKKWFSRKETKVNMFKSLGVQSIVEDGAKSSLTNAKNILKKLEMDKQYYLSTGRHAAIVRKVEDVITSTSTGEILYSGTKYQYLELQSSSFNGWKDFNDDVRETFKNRFGCSSSTMYYSTAYATDIDQLQGDGFKEILGYINTAEDLQKKGVSGHIR